MLMNTGRLALANYILGNASPGGFFLSAWYSTTIVLTPGVTVPIIPSIVPQLLSGGTTPVIDGSGYGESDYAPITLTNPSTSLALVLTGWVIFASNSGNPIWAAGVFPTPITLAPLQSVSFNPQLLTSTI
jgi:hypothetical protein